MEQQYLQNQTSETVPHFVSHPTPMPSSAIFHCDTSMEKFWENNNKKQTAKSLLMSVAATATAAKSLQSCPTLRSHRRQPTRLPRPRDSPGKNTGVGCHFLLQCMKVKSESEVAQSCPTLSNPMDHSLPGSSIHGIFQAGVLEWGAIAFTDIKKIKLEQEYSPYW